jgi:hypothetical protein
MGNPTPHRRAAITYRAGRPPPGRATGRAMFASKLATTPLGGNRHRQICLRSQPEAGGDQAPLAGPAALFGGLEELIAMNRGSSFEAAGFEAAPKHRSGVRTEVLRGACACWRA